MYMHTLYSIGFLCPYLLANKIINNEDRQKQHCENNRHYPKFEFEFEGGSFETYHITQNESTNPSVCKQTR